MVTLSSIIQIIFEKNKNTLMYYLPSWTAKELQDLNPKAKKTKESNNRQKWWQTDFVDKDPESVNVNSNIGFLVRKLNFNLRKIILHISWKSQIHPTKTHYNLNSTTCQNSVWSLPSIIHEPHNLIFEQTKGIFTPK